MKFKFKDKDDRPILLPEIGQLWRHTDGGNHVVYMRINDEHGCTALREPVSSIEKYFYSVDIRDGRVAVTMRCAKNIQLLKLENENIIPA